MKTITYHSTLMRLAHEYGQATGQEKEEALRKLEAYQYLTLNSDEHVLDYVNPYYRYYND